MKPQSYFTLCVMTLFLLLPLVATVPPKTFAGSEPKKLNILFLSSFTKDLPAQSAIENGLDQALGFRRGQHDLFFEFIDNPRLHQKNVIAALPRYLEMKYEGIDFDFVVGWGVFASLFLSTHNELFTHAHLIYVEAIGVDLFESRDQTEKETVVVVDPDFAETYQEMLRLQRPQKIYVIGATKDIEAQAMVEVFKNTFPAGASNLEVEYLLDKTLEQVATTLEGITRKDVVAFYLLMFSDGEGTNMTPYAVVNRIASRSAVPIYCFFEPLIGSGVVGGYVLSYENIGLHLGHTMLAIFRGEAVPSFSPMRYVYDWNTLQRWNIAESLIPDGALFVNRPPDIFVLYRWHLLGVLISFIVLTSLSLLLYRALSRSKQAEAALLRNEANLRSAQEVARLGGFLFDTSKNIFSWTEGTEKVFGVQPTSNVDYRAFLRILHPGDRQTVEKHWKEALKGQPCDIDCRIIIDDNTRWMRVKVEVESDGSGRPRFLKGIIQDITDRRHAELEVQRHREELALVARRATFGELTATLAHELNQPLAAIHSYAQAAKRFLAGDQLDLDEADKSLAGIVASNRRAKEVIRQIKTALKKQSFVLSRLDIKDLIREVVMLVSRGADERKISLRLDLAADLPPVFGNRVQLEQVILNLIVNAVEAMGYATDGSGELVVRAFKDEPDLVTVSVQDSGIGIDEEHMDLIFDAFYTTKPEGLGMGLAISRSIIEEQGGRLWASRNTDQGTTFSFTVPIYKGDQR